ncbi:discoidin domain-containing protein [Microbulbifer sp. CAU 1566]|uniref:di-heme oxidoredictase family protein n=1 Tax=Microbulbifer sp. CAU 1566 TaxID=2933269 RepID=UPI0020049172|nr:di-heme oxidoredictase family protein [Microbulbifer sp. CAU 1566]MCK7597744.1 discoidin domain-containing protein [Microbulbifer sp. CAU 1566]
MMRKINNTRRLQGVLAGRLVAVAALVSTFSWPALAAENLALNKPVSASTQLRPAADAVDGSGYSRWESEHGVTPSWLSIDLGASTELGKIELDWEAANPKRFEVQGSNDGNQWTTLASKNDGVFGNRTDVLDLSGSYRHLRVMALEPSEGNAWGYSLFEVRVEGEGGEPTGPVAYVPLFPEGIEALEQIQYTEPDGTLVTLMGARPTERHARERGEPWDWEDVQPGRYLTFPPFYFQNRTFGLEIRDNVAAGGNKVQFYMHVNAGSFYGTTFSLFRNVLDPTVTEFGWSLNYGFNNPNEGGQPLCHAGVPDCFMEVDSNWRTDPHSPLQVGDKIELAPAPRLQTPVIDGGGERYYSFEQLYVVGVGMRPWYGIHPNLDSEPLPSETLLGGDTSISYNYSEEPMRMFQQMANNIGIQNTQRFVEGRRLFHTSFDDGVHSEFPNENPVFSAHSNQLGPRFNAERCIGCHIQNGRSATVAVGETLDTLSVLTGDSNSNPHPVYGFNIQQQAQDSGAADYSVRIQSMQTQYRTLNDGTQVELQKPLYQFAGAVPDTFSVRQAPQVIGLGLLEAIDEAYILVNVDPEDSNGDGIRGRANFVTDPETGQTRLGRLGWKAAKAGLRHQVAEALVQDMGITSPVYPLRDCQKSDDNCHVAGVSTHVSETELTRLHQYLALLGVPAQRSLRSGYPAGIRVSPEHDMNPQEITLGEQKFGDAGCTGCHKASFTTSDRHPLAELRNQQIKPYTDLLLHDMGPDLADSLAQGEAAGNLWRTAPLWGLGSLKYVQNGEENVRYLHDGRARTLDEAILWHGGEATQSRLNYESMSAGDRNAVKAFLNSL